MINSDDRQQITDPISRLLAAWDAFDALRGSLAQGQPTAAEQTRSTVALTAIIRAWDEDMDIAMPDSADECAAIDRFNAVIDAARDSLTPRVWTQNEIDELTSVCWHCGDVLQGLGTHCEYCPAPGDCDDEDCEECADRKVGTRG